MARKKDIIFYGTFKICSVKNFIFYFTVLHITNRNLFNNVIKAGYLNCPKNIKAGYISCPKNIKKTERNNWVQI